MSELDAIRQRTEDKKRKLEEIRRKKAERELAAKSTSTTTVPRVESSPSSDDIIKSVDSLLSSHAASTTIVDNPISTSSTTTSPSPSFATPAISIPTHTPMSSMVTSSPRLERVPRRIAYDMAIQTDDDFAPTVPLIAKENANNNATDAAVTDASAPSSPSYTSESSKKNALDTDLVQIEFGPPHHPPSPTAASMQPLLAENERLRGLATMLEQQLLINASSNTQSTPTCTSTSSSHSTANTSTHQTNTSNETHTVSAEVIALENDPLRAYLDHYTHETVDTIETNVVVAGKLGILPGIKNLSQDGCIPNGVTTQGRPVIATCFFSIHTELVAVSYGAPLPSTTSTTAPMGIGIGIGAHANTTTLHSLTQLATTAPYSSPPGLVIVYNILTMKPLFVFTHAAPITAIVSHPRRAPVLILGNECGQLLYWRLSTKVRSHIEFSSSLAAGHSSRIIAIFPTDVDSSIPNLVAQPQTRGGGDGRHRLVTVSVDGVVCVWMGGNKPITTIQIDAALLSQYIEKQEQNNNDGVAGAAISGGGSSSDYSREPISLLRSPSTSSRINGTGTGIGQISAPSTPMVGSDARASFSSPNLFGNSNLLGNSGNSGQVASLLSSGPSSSPLTGTSSHAASPSLSALSSLLTNITTYGIHVSSASIPSSSPLSIAIATADGWLYHLSLVSSPPTLLSVLPLASATLPIGLQYCHWGVDGGTSAGAGADEDEDGIQNPKTKGDTSAATVTGGVSAATARATTAVTAMSSAATSLLCSYYSGSISLYSLHYHQLIKVRSQSFPSPLTTSATHPHYPHITVAVAGGVYVVDWSKQKPVLSLPLGLNGATTATIGVITRPKRKHIHANTNTSAASTTSTSNAASRAKTLENTFFAATSTSTTTEDAEEEMKNVDEFVSDMRDDGMGAGKGLMNEVSTKETEDLFFCVIGCIDGSCTVLRLSPDVLFGSSASGHSELEYLRTTCLKAVEDAVRQEE